MSWEKKVEFSHFRNSLLLIIISFGSYLFSQSWQEEIHPLANLAKIGGKRIKTKVLTSSNNLVKFPLLV